jgi:hypothetical protein
MDLPVRIEHFFGVNQPMGGLFLKRMLTHCTPFDLKVPRRVFGSLPELTLSVDLNI